MQFCLFNQRAKNAASSALALGLGPHHNGTYFRKMRAVEMQRAAAQEDAAIGLGNREVADVFAYLGERSLQQRAVGRELIHQVVDVGGVLEQSLTHQHERPPG